ncbi:PD-(D/E)XK nuclease family protein [Desulfovibrio inopinatus]|uniref:PD-(D/E)XK nuclease family protein n=1 Tax=Desulfovibrio inopinatus TaxID=102109 RepID=UPI0004251673|nr:PD-(D/E)XK nuclease family protein [Desulfovibrio inopinatus]
MNTPNLFTYATKELSQDAFLCWLSAWADPKYAANEPTMHKCAQQFILWLLKHGGISEVNSVESLEIRQQYYSIDILIIVNNEYTILIEDKVHSNQHGNQLKRYLDRLVEEDKIPRAKIVPIYLKTGNPESGEYDEAIKNEYSVVQRRDLLDLFDKKDIHPLFHDFYSYLEKQEEEMNSWMSSPLSIWSTNWSAWIGFYSKIYDHFSKKFKPNEHGWGYIANPNGGFMSYWLHYGENLHISLQEKALCIKILENNKEKRSETRKQWYDIVSETAKNSSLCYSKPARFGSGSYMTVVTRDNGYIFVDEDGIINLEKTIMNIEEAYTLIKDCTG